jgi:hypothetical protein
MQDNSLFYVVTLLVIASAVSGFLIGYNIKSMSKKKLKDNIGNVVNILDWKRKNYRR